MWLVSVTSQVWMGSRCVQFGGIALSLSYWSLEVQHGTSWQNLKKRFVALHKDGWRKEDCQDPETELQQIGKDHTAVLTGQVRLRTGFTMVAQRRWVHMLSIISRGCVWEIDIWVLPALLQRLKGWGVSLTVLRPYAAHCMAVPEGSLF